MSTKTTTRKVSPAAAKARRSRYLSDTTIGEATFLAATVVADSATDLLRHYADAPLPAGYARRVVGATRRYDSRPKTVGEATMVLVGAAEVALFEARLAAGVRGPDHLLDREQAAGFHAAAAVLADLDTRVSKS